ncbi:MAG TPA: fused MFS/spermidine synthase [Vicinamibacterales bacterium]|nr:fused MFS/spermidine synthase [Vicinamibacterales bacterium]
MTLLFASALFVNALLLFLVQPMFAKLLLPRFGGSPAVWTTCMLFFQSALLAGYAYSHSLVKLRNAWQQAAVHLVVIALPILTLPIAVSTSLSASDDPVVSVLSLSVFAVGAPFFALATSAPLLQRWFASAHQGRQVDPYFLYAASNVGSFASLLLYPSVIEPALALSTQTRLWSLGYSAAVVLTVVCAVVMWRRAPRVTDPTPQMDAGSDVVTWSRRVRWIALSFVPSSLMLAVTAYLSTDVAAVPLLWVIPLALYLVTFVVTFSSWSGRVVTVCQRIFPLVLLFLSWMLLSEARLPLPVMAGTHLAAFFVLSLLCHGTLAEDRPAPARLTDFYLSVSVGGALGGVFNTLLAPLLFRSVLEYPLALACGTVLLTLRPGVTPLLSGARWWVKPAIAAALTIAALKWPGSGTSVTFLSWGLLMAAVVVCLSVSRDRLRLGVAVLLMLGFYAVLGGRGFANVAYASRTFFGTYRVMADQENRSFTMFHGTTIHGKQDIGSDKPLTYFHKDSPIAQVFATRPEGTVNSVGVVGLGIGTLVAYAQPGQRWVLYEIDPEVERIARDDRYFTHLKDCGARCEVIIGDARLSLQNRSDKYDVLVLDAFSSDSLPVHLLTREAVELYLSRLTENGVLAINISNNHLALRPVVGGIIRDLGLTGRARYQDPKHMDRGLYPSRWAVVARSEAALGPVATDKRWERLSPGNERTWTDDFSNIWRVIQWRRAS